MNEKGFARQGARKAGCKPARGMPDAAFGDKTRHARAASMSQALAAGLTSTGGQTTTFGLTPAAVGQTSAGGQTTTCGLTPAAVGQSPAAGQFITVGQPRKSRWNLRWGAGRSLRFAAILVLLAGCLALLPAQKAESPAGAEKSRNQVLAGMLGRLNDIILSSGRNDTVSETWTSVRKLMAASRLQFLVGPDSGGDLVGHGAIFEAAEQGPSRVIVARDLLDLMGRNDVLVMSMVLNALVFAEAAFKDPPGYRLSRTNVVRGYQYSMDALYVQSLFCRDYAGVFPGNEGGYTGFLAGGLRLDGLSTVALYVLQVDQVLISAFLDLELRLRAGMSPEAWYDKVESLFKDVDKNLALAAAAAIPSPGGKQAHSLEEQKSMSYVAAVGALTLVTYAPEIINVQLGLHPALQSGEFEARRAKFAAHVENLVPRLRDLAGLAKPWRDEYLGRLLPR